MTILLYKSSFCAFNSLLLFCFILISPLTRAYGMSASYTSSTGHSLVNTHMTVSGSMRLQFIKFKIWVFFFHKWFIKVFINLSEPCGVLFMMDGCTFCFRVLTAIHCHCKVWKRQDVFKIQLRLHSPEGWKSYTPLHSDKRRFTDELVAQLDSCHFKKWKDISFLYVAITDITLVTVTVVTDKEQRFDLFGSLRIDRQYLRRYCKSLCDWDIFRSTCGCQSQKLIVWRYLKLFFHIDAKHTVFIFFRIIEARF